MNYKISKLIFKSISKTLTEEEKQVLEGWLSDPKNKSLFERITNSKTINRKIKIYNEADKDKIYKRIETQIIKRSKVRYLRILKYAAIFIGVIGLVGYFYQYEAANDSTKLEITNEKITLQLDDGTIKTINEDTVTKVKDKNGNVVGAQKGKQIVYNASSTQKKLVYNTLKVPYGKRFELVLSDGTKVHLNAGTSLKYPTQFIGTENREVFLNGEAYFDVAENKEHPFVVNANSLNVFVTGTEFNITSYPEDDTIDVVLVEGAVGLYKGENSKYNSTTDVSLSPGYKGSYNKNSKHISTNKVDTYLYTSWLLGEQLYRNIPFKQILPKLERHYNVTIVNTNASLNNELFYASFKDESIENVLNYFNEIHEIEYQIENNQVIIK